MAEDTETQHITRGIGAVQLSDPPGREWTRHAMALGLIFLLAAEIVYTMASITFGWMTFEQAKEFFAFVTGPTVGLVGPVAGFYFSSKH